MRRQILPAVGLALFALLLWGQDQKIDQKATAPAPTPNSDAASHDMSDMNSDMHDMSNVGSVHAMESMEGHHMDMGAHMKMTTLRDLKPGDQEKADAVVQAARKVA